MGGDARIDRRCGSFVRRLSGIPLDRSPPGQKASPRSAKKPVAVPMRRAEHHSHEFAVALADCAICDKSRRWLPCVSGRRAPAQAGR